MKLKHLLFILSFALLSGVAFTSCLSDNDDNGTYSATYVVKVTGSLGNYRFISGKKTLVPTNQGVFTTVLTDKYGILQYLYSQKDLQSTATEMPVTVQGYAPITSVNVYPNVVGQTVNAPIFGVGPSSATTLEGAFIEENQLALPVSYLYKRVSGSNPNADLATHSFFAYFDPADPQTTANGVMAIRLKHSVTDASLNNDRTAIATEYKHLDLTAVVHEYQNLYAKLPTSVKVVYEQSGTGSYTNPIEQYYSVSFPTK